MPILLVNFIDHAHGYVQIARLRQKKTNKKENRSIATENSVGRHSSCLLLATECSFGAQPKYQTSRVTCQRLRIHERIIIFFSK